MSEVGVRLLDLLATYWPSPVRKRDERFGAVPGSEEYSRAYVREQFLRRASRGLGLQVDLPPIWGKDVLEIGCGLGGITCFIASLGARRAVGIDVHGTKLDFGVQLARELSETRGGAPLPVELMEMDARELEFPDGSFDLVLADNLFEHVEQPERVFAEIHRVLRPGGQLLIPTFCAIHSKYGLHLKHGIKMPWANLFFSERTIVNALRRQAERRPELFDVYPGLKNGAEKVRDVRQYRDLNGITHESFMKMVKNAGFTVKNFKVFGTPLGKVLFRLAPGLDQTIVGDVLSMGAGAVLERAQT